MEWLKRGIIKSARGIRRMSMLYGTSTLLPLSPIPGLLAAEAGHSCIEGMTAKSIPMNLVTYLTQLGFSMRGFYMLSENALEAVLKNKTAARVVAVVGGMVIIYISSKDVDLEPGLDEALNNAQKDIDAMMDNLEEQMNQTEDVL